jgi:hypoxanthine phosphoribosyltransferase
MITGLIERIKWSGKVYNKVVGIRQGGIYVSLPIAHALRLPHEEVIISRYDDTSKRLEPLVQNVTFSGSPVAEKILVVDDIVDEGDTLRLFSEHFSNDYDVATLFTTKPNTTEFYMALKQDKWIVFPWEN